MRILVILVSLAVLATANKVSYENYKVFKITIKSENDAATLKTFLESNKEYKLWSAGISAIRPTAIMASPTYASKLKTQLNALNMPWDLMIDNVQSLIDRQFARKDNSPSFGWTSYHTLNEIHSWLDSLAKKYPGKVTPIIAGRTTEGRSIKGVKISFRKNNPGIFIEAGIHANEWISPATATYLINELLSSKDPAVRDLAVSYDWYIVPLINADGYVYTHTTDRMWRKNRPGTNSSSCVGVDLNRNWDYKWMVVGASNDSCSEHYAGKKPFSEIETRSLSEYIKSISDKLFAYVDFHSFGQLLMVPYGHTSEYLDNFNETYAIGLKTANALSRRYGTSYKVGNIAETIYPASGSSLDWVKANFKLPIAYCYELRDEGYYGMLLPAEQIIPNAQEILESLIVMFQEAKKIGYPKP